MSVYDNNIKNHSFSEFVHALGEPGEDDEADDDDEEKDEILPLPWKTHTINVCYSKIKCLKVNRNFNSQISLDIFNTSWIIIYVK